MDATTTTCKNCGRIFTPARAGAQYCTGRCRTVAYRARHAIVPATTWFDYELRRPRADNALLAERLLGIAKTEDGGDPKTGRRYYYLALSYGYIDPSMEDTEAAKKERAAAYKRITNVLKTLRIGGRLDWEMVLDLTRELDQWRTFESPRAARAHLRQMYDEDRWLGQPHYPILIVEKDTMEPVCRPLAMNRQMPFASSRGYGSLRLQYDVADMLNTRHAKTGQMAIVYFVSDLDPSGLDLQRAWEEALERFLVDAHFVRIGLTKTQVDSNVDVRGRPLEHLGIDVKPSDSRATAYIEQYGTKCWEVDILPASVIEAALNQEIGSWLDVALWRRRTAEIERARKLL
jgi:hypothetical protein